MAYDTWPGTLPASPQPGSKVPLGDNTANFTPEEGPDIVWRKATVASGETTMTFRLTQAESVVLRDFFATTLVDGAKPFSGLNDVLGVGHNWRFVQPPSIVDTAAGFFEATCNLEVVP